MEGPGRHGAMRVLLVTPVQDGSGETITAMHVAEDLVAKGHRVHFLASPFARRFIEHLFPGAVRELAPYAGHNQLLWKETVTGFRPDAVVFADYPLLFFPAGCAPLAGEPGWIESLDDLDACLVTLDHFGFAQGEMGFFVGPPHLSFHYQSLPSIPGRMRVMLPCPMHEPGPVEGRIGLPFRYWNVPFQVPGPARRETRRRFLRREEGYLVFHPVPTWAWRNAEALGLPYYRFLPSLLDHFLGGVPGGVTVVSVNSGSLLVPPPSARIRILNVPLLPRPEFEALLCSSDLVLTENKLSIAMGKAICGLRPCAALKNSYRILELMDRLSGPFRRIVLGMENARPGSVYPFEVFPTVTRDVLERLCLYRENSLTEGFRELEIFDGQETGEALRGLLVDGEVRRDLRRRQQVYVDRLARLREPSDVLSDLVAQDRGSR
jgi:hypothetical protein